MKVSDKYLLDLWRQIVGKRAGWRCEFPDCGKIGTAPHHVFSRENLSTRYDPDNGIWLCYGHHCFAHNNSREFKKEIIYWKVRSRQWLDELTIKANQIVTISPDLFRQDQKIILQGLKAA